MSKAAKHQVIGKSQQRVDGVVKATGQAVYAMDLEIPGMLHAKVLRSPFPHARLLRIDGARAAALPGVATVLTRETLDGMNPYYGSAYKDQTVVALDKVRYAGDPVAAVVADDEATAAAALALIEAEYEELPAVTDIADAIAPGAPLVHEVVADADELHGHAYRVPEEFRGTNTCYAYDYARGDVDKGFAQADEIFEDTFIFPQIQHYPLEPHITIARVEDGHVTLWASTQDPFTLQRHIAEFFSIPINRVRVIVPHIGGAYGGKLSVKNEPLAAALAWKTGRPVKITHTSEETFLTITRHPARFRIKTASPATASSWRASARSTWGPAPTRTTGRGCRRRPATGRRDRTRSPTSRSRPTRCTPTPCPPARSAASARCRSPGPTNRRWTPSPASSASTRWSSASET